MGNSDPALIHPEHRSVLENDIYFPARLDSYSSHLYFCQFSLLPFPLFSARRRNADTVEAASQIPHILQNIGKSFHSCLCDPYIVTHRGNRVGAREPDLDSLWSSMRKTRKEDAYRVEPELHDGCVVEFIDFPAQGD